MNDKMYDINRNFMNEIGLEVGNHRRLIDQDSGAIIKNYDTRVFVSPGSKSGLNSVEFNPALNNKQAEKFMLYYTKKLSDLEDFPEILTYYTKDTDDDKAYVEIVTEDSTKIRSKSYINESLRYMDIVFQLNGNDEVDLSEYDSISAKELNDIHKEQRREEKFMKSDKCMEIRKRNKKNNGNFINK